MSFEFLGRNIQTIRKQKGYTQQELADQVGINFQNLSKIERGVNLPTFETLEKIMKALDVSPNTLLSGELKTTSHMKDAISAFLERKARLDVELAHGQYDHFFDTEEEWLEYERERLEKYIISYVKSKNTETSDLYLLKEHIDIQQLKKLLQKYNNYYSYELFGETLDGQKQVNPFIEENTIQDSQKKR